MKDSIVAALRMSAGSLFLLALVAAHVRGQTFTTLASFNGSNGKSPCGTLTLSGNTLYGTTYEGGAYSSGTVFSVPITGGSPTVLASLNHSSGDYPRGGLTLIGNTLYGTTSQGGNLSLYSDYGAVFSVPITGGSPTVLASFNGTNGYSPQDGLTLIGNNLYGTTTVGGNLSLDSGYGYGTVFSIPLSAMPLRILER